MQVPLLNPPHTPANEKSRSLHEDHNSIMIRYPNPDSYNQAASDELANQSNCEVLKVTEMAESPENPLKTLIGVHNEKPQNHTNAHTSSHQFLHEAPSASVVSIETQVEKPNPSLSTFRRAGVLEMPTHQVHTITPQVKQTEPAMYDGVLLNPELSFNQHVNDTLCQVESPSHQQSVFKHLPINYL